MTTPTQSPLLNGASKGPWAYDDDEMCIKDAEGNPAIDIAYDYAPNNVALATKAHELAASHWELLQAIKKWRFYNLLHGIHGDLGENTYAGAEADAYETLHQAIARAEALQKGGRDG